MPSITLRISGDGLPVTLRVGRAFFNRVAAYVNRAQVKRVENQQTIDGMQIQRNTPRTQKVKARRGQPQLSLIDGWRSTGVRWTLAGRSGGKVGEDVRYRTRRKGKSALSGKQTREHHFVGPRALRQQASDVSAVVWLPSESSAIATNLERKGYRRWWGFADADLRGIQAMWLATLRGMIRARKRALRG